MNLLDNDLRCFWCSWIFLFCGCFFSLVYDPPYWLFDYW